MLPPNKLPNPPPEPLPPRLLKADPMNFPTSPERTFCRPLKNPSIDEPLEDGRFVVYFVVGLVNEDPPKVESSPYRLP